MIDVFKELEKYTCIDINKQYGNKESMDSSEELPIILKNITKVYERIGKEQFKSNNDLEEVIEMLEESRIKDDLIKEMKEIIDNKDIKINKSMLALMSIYDTFDDMYSFSIKSGNETLKEAISFQREKNVKLLLTSGIAVIGEVDESFDSNIHIAKEVKFDEGFKNNHIIEVLRNGYVYEGEVIRKAEVIINKGELCTNE